MTQYSDDAIRSAVRENYARVATEVNSSDQSSCCGGGTASGSVASVVLGYRPQDLLALPEGADLGLGCGNPNAIAALQPGETVVDLGSGAGIDAFLAARAVGESGAVIGVDMTPDMVSKARANAEAGGFTNVEFRLGEIEHLPIEDASVDVIISNCVINLSPDKQSVFHEAYRVLRSGGRVAVADVVATAELPPEIANDLSLYSGCVAGATFIDDVRAMMERAGFADIRIAPKDESKVFIEQWAPGRNVADYAVSATIEARKP